MGFSSLVKKICFFFVDYILVYEDKRATTVDQLIVSLPPPGNNDENEKLALALQKQKDRYRLFKRRFLGNLSKIGLLMETVCAIIINRKKLNLVFFL